MNNSSFVTIAIPAYKRHWLAEAIESALNQDYHNIELLIVDDHSPQNLKEVVEPYLRDPRVHYYYNAKNLGKKSIVLNWNRCLELAHGEFFVLLCDDDILERNFVSTLLLLAEKYPQCNVFHGRRKAFNILTGKETVDDVWPEYETCKQFWVSDGFSRWHTITEFMYRTSHVKPLGYYVLPMGWGSDDVSILRFIEKGGIASSKECIAMFRESDEHISGTYKCAYQKAKARIMEFEFLSKFKYCNWTKEDTMNKLIMHVLVYLPHMGYWEKIKIMFRLPWNALYWKSRLYYILLGWRVKSDKKIIWECRS